MDSPAEIEHTGIICSISEKGITVKITAHPACSGCYAAGICNASGTSEKYFYLPEQKGFQSGQSVKITTSLSNGYKALFLGYVVPLLILISTMAALVTAGFGELAAGVSSVTGIAIYYLTLFLVRKKIEKRMTFTLKPA